MVIIIIILIIIIIIDIINIIIPIILIIINRSHRSLPLIVATAAATARDGGGSPRLGGIVAIDRCQSGCNSSRWGGIPAGASGLCGLACFDGRRRAVGPG